MRTLRLPLYISALLLLPSAASAGPIYFSSQLFSDTTPVQYGGASLFTITHTSSVPTYLDPATSPSALYATLNLTPQSPSLSDLEANHGSISALTRFWIALNLTDTESGASGQLKLTGDAWTYWTAWDGGTPSLGGSGIVFALPGYTDLTLGLNKYRLYSDVLAAGPDGQMNADVRLTLVDPVQTPEPTTLALAGIGLFPAIGLYFRRRMG